MRKQIQVFFFPKASVLSKNSGVVAFCPFTEIFAEGINVTDAFQNWWKTLLVTTQRKWKLLTKPDLANVSVLYGDSSENGNRPIFQLSIQKKRENNKSNVGENDFLKVSQMVFIAVCPSTHTFYFVANSAQPKAVLCSTPSPASAPASPHSSPMSSPHQSLNNLQSHSFNQRQYSHSWSQQNYTPQQRNQQLKTVANTQMEMPQSDHKDHESQEKDTPQQPTQRNEPQPPPPHQNTSGEVPQSDHKDQGLPQGTERIQKQIESNQEQKQLVEQQKLSEQMWFTQSEDEKHTDQSDQEKQHSNSENENRKANKAGQTASNEGSSLPTSPTKTSISQSFFPTKWIEWHVVAMKVVHVIEC